MVTPSHWKTNVVSNCFNISPATPVAYEAITEANHEGQYVYVITYESKSYLLKGFTFAIPPLDTQEMDQLEETIFSGLAGLQQVYAEYANSKLASALSPHFCKMFSIDTKRLTARSESRPSTYYLELLHEYPGIPLEALSENRVALNLDLIFNIMYQSATALALLHKSGMAHLAFKRESLTYDKDADLVKILDLHNSSGFVFPEGIHKPAKSPGKMLSGISQEYAPPEILQYEAHLGAKNRKKGSAKEIIYSKIDIYCWGIAFYALISNKQSTALKQDADNSKMRSEKEYLGYLEKVKKELENWKESKEGAENEKKRLWIRRAILQSLAYAPLKRPSFDAIIASAKEITQNLPYVAKATVAPPSPPKELLFQNKDSFFPKIEEDKKLTENWEQGMDEIEKESEFLSAKARPYEELLKKKRTISPMGQQKRAASIYQQAKKRMSSPVEPQFLHSGLCVQCKKNLGNYILLKCFHGWCLECAEEYLFGGDDVEKLQCRKCNVADRQIISITLQCGCKSVLKLPLDKEAKELLQPNVKAWPMCNNFRHLLSQTDYAFLFGIDPAIKRFTGFNPLQEINPLLAEAQPLLKAASEDKFALSYYMYSGPTISSENMSLLLTNLLKDPASVRLKSLLLSSPSEPPADRAEQISKYLQDSKCPIRYLNLKSNCIGFAGMRFLAKSLLLNKTIRVLNLSNNNLQNKGMLDIGQIIQECPHIKRLVLSSNNVGFTGAKTIADALKASRSLAELDLSSNDGITDTGAQYFADTLLVNNTLRELDLEKASITAEGIKYLAESLKANKSLALLSLFADSIKDEGAKYLAEALKVNTSLLNIILGISGIEDDGAKHLAEALKGNKSLFLLRLEHNFISETGAKYFAEALLSNNVLQVLILEHNDISTEGAEAFLKIAKVNKGLKVLVLKDNKDISEECKGKLKTEFEKVSKKLEI